MKKKWRPEVAFPVIATLFLLRGDGLDFLAHSSPLSMDG
jgi:hypothetical protein